MKAIRHFQTITKHKIYVMRECFRVGLMISQDNKFAAVQLYQFVPYTYTPVTSVRYYTGSDAVAVSTFLEKCKTA